MRIYRASVTKVTTLKILEKKIFSDFIIAFLLSFGKTKLLYTTLGRYLLK